MYTKILAVLLMILVVAGFNCKKQGGQTNNEPLKQLPIDIPPLPVAVQYDQPGLSLVGGTHELNPVEKDEILARINRGIQRTIEISQKRHGFKNGQDLYESTVIYARPTSRSLDGNCPTLNLKSGQKIAGIVINYGIPLITPPFIFIAYDGSEPTTEQCKQWIERVVAYEREHIELYNNDRDWFVRTTGANDIHPIFEGNEPEGLKDVSDNVICGFSVLPGGLRADQLSPESEREIQNAYRAWRRSVRSK